MLKLTITEVEDAINKCSRTEKQIDHGLPPAQVALAEIYGQMIFEKKADIDFDEYVDKKVFSESHVAAIQKYHASSTHDQHA